MTREQLTCTRCGKRLSRKTARQIDGVVMCSTCMFAPQRPQVDQSPEGGDACGSIHAGHGPASQDAPNSTPELPV